MTTENHGKVVPENRRKVLITGAQGALGSHMIHKYLQTGWEVSGTFFPSLAPLPSSEFEKSIHWIKADLTQSQSVAAALSGHSFDALVHCAGGFRYSICEQTTDEDLEFLINLNLKSAFYLVRALIPGMKQRNFGRIVLISSKATLQAGTGMAAYAASKSGLNMLTSALAEETKSFDITVNAVLPTVIDTPSNRKDMPQARFADWVSPDHLAELIWSLTSTPWGKTIHGAFIPVAGRI